MWLVFFCVCVCVCVCVGLFGFFFFLSFFRSEHLSRLAGGARRGPNRACLSRKVESTGKLTAYLPRW